MIVFEQRKFRKGIWQVEVIRFLTLYSFFFFFHLHLYSKMMILETK